MDNNSIEELNARNVEIVKCLWNVRKNDAERCPFCGGEAGCCTFAMTLDVMLYIYCKKCNATGGPQFFTGGSPDAANALEIAIEEWNRRVGEEEV